MNSKRLFKSKSIILRKFIAGSLTAIFGAGAFSNYCAASEKLFIDNQIENISNKEDAIEKIEAEDLISKNEGNKVFGYDENKDKNLLEGINDSIKEILKFFPGEARDLIVKEYFGNAYSKCKAKEDFLYNEIQNFFRKNFGRDLTKKDIIFAVIKYLGSGDVKFALDILIKKGQLTCLKDAVKEMFCFDIKKVFKFGDENLITGVKITENGGLRVKKIITDKDGTIKFAEDVKLWQKLLPKKYIIIIAALVLTVLAVVVLAITFSTVKDGNKYEKPKDEKGGSESGSGQNQSDNANIQETVDFEQKLGGKSSDPKVKGASLATEIAKRCAITILGSASGPLVAEVCSSVQKNGSPKSEAEKKGNTDGQA